jgi:hypothetical protein
MLWLVPLTCAVAGLAALAWLAAQVRRDVEPLELQRDIFGRALRPAVVELRRETEQLRARLDGR